MKNITDQIIEKKDQIAKLEEKMQKDSQKISVMQKELETLQSLEIKAMIKELNMPVSDIKKLILSLKEGAVPGQPV